MSTLGTLRNFGLFICALLTLILNVSGVDAQVDSALRQKSQQADSIAATLSRDGSVRVIVEIVAAIADTSYRQGPAGFDAVKRVVDTAQQGVLATHVGSDVAKAARWSVRQMSYFPLMAMTIDAAELSALASDSRVLKIWEDVLRSPNLTESVPIIGMPSVYTRDATGAGTIIAVLDTGVQSSHPFLTGKVTQEACFSTTSAAQSSTSVCPNGQADQFGTGAGTNCSADTFDCDHGTHVAGIAAGRNTVNDNPGSGVARGANVFAVQVSSSFTGATCTNKDRPSPCASVFSSDEFKGLEHVLSRVGVIPETIAAVNISLGGGNNPGTCDGEPLKRVIDQLRAANVATIISSGNDGFTGAVGSPGCISTAITVGSTTKSDTLSSHSNSSPVVDLLAPGSLINSSVPGRGYGLKSGTSMAAPHVAGAFAAIRSVLPSATVDQIESALKSTGTPVTDTRPGGTQIKPRIRVDLALQQLQAVLPLSVTPREPFHSFGYAGGPFSPSSKRYTLRNLGTRTLNWQQEIIDPLVTWSLTSGSLEPGASIDVTVSISERANELPVGHRIILQRFRDLTNNYTSYHSPYLSVYNRGGVVSGPCTDSFADAPMLPGRSGSVSGNNASATGESGEPVHSWPVYSVWCKFTAAASGTATFTTVGSDYDTTLTAHSGPSIGALNLIASSDNFGGATTSRISFPVEAGITYFIAVDGAGDSRGNYTLNYTLPSRGGGDRPARFDFNGDGTSDILWHNASTGSVGQFRMSSGVPTWAAIGSGGSGWSIVGVGDFNGDRTSDILWYNPLSRAVGQFRMVNGVATWAGIGTGAAGWSIVGTGDFNGDGTTDILWYNASTRAVGMFRMANGRATWVGIGTGGPGWSIAGSGDVNGDGTTDILWYNASTRAVGMFRMANGRATWVGIGTGGPGWSIAGSGDVNGDGTTDILWYNASTRAVGMFRMANGRATWEDIGTGGPGWSIAGSGDFNNDGTTDILLYNASTRAVGMLQRTNGVTRWVGIGQGGGASWSIAGTGDYNGDGTTDILWHNASTRAVGMFRMMHGVATWVNIGTGGAGWSIAGNNATVGHPAHVASASE